MRSRSECPNYKKCFNELKTENFFRVQGTIKTNLCQLYQTGATYKGNAISHPPCFVNKVKAVEMKLQGLSNFIKYDWE